MLAQRFDGAIDREALRDPAEVERDVRALHRAARDAEVDLTHSARPIL